MARVILIFLTSFSLSVLLVSCTEPDSQSVKSVFEDMAAPTPFTRAYSLTENADATLRVFAKEDSDDTDLYISRRAGSEWTTPEKLDLPHRRTLTSPSFSPADGRLYYSSDEEYPEWPGRKDLNIWSVELSADTIGQPVPLPSTINTGANEVSPTMDSDGRLFFASNHSSAGGGGYDIMTAIKDTDGRWVASALPVLNDKRADDHLSVTADGKRLIFYSHRTPKAGSADLWVADMQSDGTWATPVNAGQLINTSAIEFGAGQSGDGETLFFSRDGVLMEVPMDVLDKSIARGLSEPN